ncbi:MAG: hypothetical protein HY060_02375 [Proteobacteria bacterium]|nr:hypothetical protein [Pseudomonadota bacterium]
MTFPAITYGSLTQYFHNAALGHTAAISPSQISSALSAILGGGSTRSGGFNFGVSPLQQSVSASLSAARSAATTASTNAARFDSVNDGLTQLGQIVGTLAPSNTGSPFGDATTLPPVGSTLLPDTLQGNIDRAQRALTLPAGGQAQERTAAQVRFNALRDQAQQLIGNLQTLHLTDANRQHALDTAVADLRSALADSFVDPHRVRALTFSAATTGSATSGGTFDASVQGNPTGNGAPVGRASARAAVDRLGQAVSAARQALAPDRALAHQQVASAQTLVGQFTQLQSQAGNGSFSLGRFNPASLFQFPSSGLLNLFA